MKWNIHHKIVATLLYSQLFDAVLSKTELAIWLISDKYVPNKMVNQQFSNLISHDDCVYLDQGSKNILSKLRRDRQSEAKQKWNRVRPVIRWLSKIPSIEFIGISGGLAVDNVDRADDIDLFVITSPSTIWTSRFFVIIILELLRVRRRYSTKSEQDLFCPNMFLSRSNLAILPQNQDLYSAHEVLQLKPVFDRNNCYTAFLQANSWVKSYLANAWRYVLNNKFYSNYILIKKNQVSLPEQVIIQIFKLCNPIFAIIQLWYMRPHKTREIVSNSVLQFHPYDIRVEIISKYTRKLKKYNIPLDSSFLKSLQ